MRLPTPEAGGCFAMSASRVCSKRALVHAFLVLGTVSGCAAIPEPQGPPRQETVIAVTESNRLIRFNAGQPAKILDDRRLEGLPNGEKILAIDFRVARGMLYGLGAKGQLYVIEPSTALAKPVGAGLKDASLVQDSLKGDIGFDFNPTVDRIRLVKDQLNARMHPDTGQLVDASPQAPGIQLDGPPAYAADDANRGRKPLLAAAAYSYNKVDEKITTNFAIDAAAGVLVTQGSREGAQPAVSPNTGRLFTVGPLKAGPIGHVAFDIADLNNAAFVAITAPGAARSRWFNVDLDSGAAMPLGTIGVREAVIGIAIEP
jgi:hypothetical protein